MAARELRHQLVNEEFAARRKPPSYWPPSKSWTGATSRTRTPGAQATRAKKSIRVRTELCKRAAVRLERVRFMQLALGNLPAVRPKLTSAWGLPTPPGNRAMTPTACTLVSIRVAQDLQLSAVHMKHILIVTILFLFAIPAHAQRSHARTADNIVRITGTKISKRGPTLYSESSYRTKITLKGSERRAAGQVLAAEALKNGFEVVTKSNWLTGALSVIIGGEASEILKQAPALIAPVIRQYQMHLDIRAANGSFSTSVVD